MLSGIFKNVSMFLTKINHILFKLQFIKKNIFLLILILFRFCCEDRKSIDQEAIRCVKALDSHNRMLTRDFISILGDRILCMCSNPFAVKTWGKVLPPFVLCLDGIAKIRVLLGFLNQE